MKTTPSRITIALPLVVGALLCAQAAQARRAGIRPWQPTRHSTARAAAREMVTHFYRGMNASLKGNPVVNEGNATGAQRGYKVSLDGRKAVEAVMVKKVQGGWVGTYEIAKYHRAKTPKITATRTLPSTYHDVMIVETAGQNSLHPVQNLETVARSDYRTKHGIAVRPVSRYRPWPGPIGPILPMTVTERRSALAGQATSREGHAMIWPGPSGDIRTKLDVRGRRGTTTLDQDFHRFVIMRGGVQPATAASAATAAQ
jgi:hypothetical protein